MKYTFPVCYYAPLFKLAKLSNFRGMYQMAFSLYVLNTDKVVCHVECIDLLYLYGVGQKEVRLFSFAIDSDNPINYLPSTFQFYKTSCLISSYTH